MRQRAKRRFYTATESAEIWDRWRRGEGLWTIARAFGKTSSSIYAHISPTGGIQPPPRRPRIGRLGIERFAPSHVSS